ncbi:MAG: DUF3795 domain-containing protein, partial [Candidatus Bathyarchaeota archaeon]|nr:DUF3795 domain-containing protein [Candidatus Bathyarchaeota archaeon]
AAIQSLPVCQGCQKGDGNEACRIRPCALSKGLSTCNECNEQGTCENLEALQNVRTSALRVGMIVKTGERKVNQQQIREWTAEIKGKFPSCIIDI